MKYLLLIIFFIISFLIGMFCAYATLPVVGKLKIDTRNEAKDVLLLDFKIPPEDLIKNKKRALVLFFVENESQIDQAPK